MNVFDDWLTGVLNDLLNEWIIVMFIGSIGEQVM